MKVVVIGDGIVGTAIAFFLKHSGANVVLVGPSAPITRSATDVSGGLLRVVDSDLTLAAVAKEGVMIFRRWRKLGMPGECGYCSCGAVFLASHDGSDAFAKIAEDLSSEDYPIRCIPNEKFGDSFPMLRLPDGAQVFFEPFGGYGSPIETRDSLLEEFVEIGGNLIRSTAVKITKLGHPAVELTDNPAQLGCDLVVVATGRGTTELLRRSGMTLIGSSAMLPKTIAIPHFIRTHTNERSEIFPVLVDTMNGTFLRPLENGQFIVGAGNDGETVGFDDDPILQHRHIIDAQQRISETVPSLYHCVANQGRIGVDAYTSSNRPVIGFMSSHPSVFVASGFSGRGFKIAVPVAASIALEILSVGHMKSSDLTQALALPDTLFSSLAITPEQELAARHRHT